MARAMSDLETIRILMNGGYIAEEIRVLKESKVTVHEAPRGAEPSRCLGHITVNTLSKLLGCGLLKVSGTRSSKHSLVRFWNAESPKRAVSSNADRLRAMDDDQLADFLHESTLAADTPWNYAFSKVFCDACEPEFCNLSQECPHGRPVDWWLKQAVSDGK